MKHFLHMAVFLLLGAGQAEPARADVYSYTNEEGAVVLSNFRMSRFATTLVPEDPAGERTIPPSKAPTGMARKTQYDRDVLEAASLYGLDSALLHAVIHVESHYSADAISHKGATGLMQLMPATAKRYGIANSLDPVQNIRGGAQYLRDLLNMFNGDVDLALAAYNAGENAVLRHGKRIPPFSETADYVRMVKTIYKKYTSGSLE